MNRWILAGDIGGTKTDLALCRDDGSDALHVTRETSFKSRDFDGLETLTRTFLGDTGPELAAAAFGVAGPVLDGRVDVTNLPWRVEAQSLADATGAERVVLMNDLETTGYGALFLEPEQILVLNEGIDRPTHRAVIAAGTGLGQAILFWDGTRYRPSATEGGHARFTPRDERELELLRYLIGRFGRVSWERVLSGPGLHSVFEFLRDVRGAEVAPAVAERLQSEDPSAVIGAAGVDDACPASREAVELFVSLYGAQACNLVLTTMALGGLYVGGGIVTKLLPVVQGGLFMEAFRASGRFERLMAETPVRVLLEPRTSLLGAARAALDATPD